MRIFNTISEFAEQERRKTIAMVPPELILLRKEGLKQYEIIKEYEFIEKIRYWMIPGIDCTYFYTQIKDKLHKDKEFSVNEKENILEFIYNLYMKENGGFRQTLRHNFSSIHAVHCAIGIINIFYNNNRKDGSVDLEKPLGRNLLEKYLTKTKVDSLIGFIKSCYFSGGFFQSPGRLDGQTINDTASALWCLWHLEALEEIKFSEVWDFMQKCTIKKDAHCSYKNRITDNQSWVCSTYYALRIKKIMAEYDPDYLAQFNEKTENGDLILNFILDAKHPKSGFGANGNLDANMIHTKGALSLLKSNKYHLDFDKYLINNKKIKNPINFKNGLIEDVRIFLAKCEYKGVYAFAETKYYQPNIYATCLSIDVKNILAKMSTGKEEMGVSDPQKNAAMKFLEFCFNRETNGYKGYSLSPAYLPKNYIGARKEAA